jgi:Aminopeptidase N
MEKVERLIRGFVPDRYDLVLDIQKLDGNVFGKIEIIGEAKNNNIALHAKDLKIIKSQINSTEVDYAIDGDRLTLLGSIVGRVKIEIEYEFKLTNQMHGAYLSSYEHDGRKEVIVATQFESHYAREAFPCVDEPEAKAVFNLSLITDVGETVLGNMPVSKSAPTDGRLLTVFGQTPRMSTYLLAFVVGKLQKHSRVNEHGVEVNTYASLSQPKESLFFATDVAARALDFFDDYFGTRYPLPKCDQVALPDFEAGAMENWGLVTYRETALLVDPKATSISARRWVLTVITHELSHQWFGNLVTMRWWDDLWLNESFATMMEYVAADAIEPSYGIWNDFFTGDVAAAMRRDCLAGVQSVRQEVGHPDEIQTLFDGAIVYAKGARLMYMLMNLVGEDNFKKGLADYFSNYAYGNTIGENLWSSLSKYVEFDVTEFMNAWIDKPGYPVIGVSSDGGSISLSQKRFLIDGDTREDRWPVPLFSSHKGLPKIFSDFDTKIDLDDLTSPIELNVGLKSHFLTNYDDQILSNLLKSDIDENTKLKLLSERVLLAKTELASSASILEVLNSTRDETSEAVWDMAGLGVRDLRIFVDTGSDDENRLKEFVGNLVEKQYKRLGWVSIDSEPEDDTKLRSLVVSLRIYSGDGEAIKRAILYYNEATSIDGIDKELRDVIISAKVRYDYSPKLIDDLLDIYKKTSSVDLRDDLYSALCGAKEKDAITRFLGLLKDRDVIRLQDVERWYISLVRNPHGQDLAWGYLRDNWSWFVEQFGDNKGYDGFPRYVASAFKTHKKLVEYKEFFGPMVNVPALKRNIEMGISEIEARVKLIQCDGDEVKRALAELSRK